jgi:hypothetical protein
MKSFIFGTLRNRGHKWLYGARAGLLFLLLLSTLGACGTLAGSSRLEAGMVETTLMNHTEARFQTLTGRKTWRESLEAGERFNLDYEATLEKGALTMQVESPQDEIIWERDLEAEASVSDTMTLVAEEGGTYTIVVDGDGAGGRYELDWNVAE